METDTALASSKRGGALCPVDHSLGQLQKVLPSQAQSFPILQAQKGPGVFEVSPDPTLTYWRALENHSPSLNLSVLSVGCQSDAHRR